MGEVWRERPPSALDRAAARPSPGVAPREEARDDDISTPPHRLLAIDRGRGFAGVTVRALNYRAMTVLHHGRPDAGATRALWFIQHGAGAVVGEHGVNFDAGDTIVLPRSRQVTITTTAPGKVLEVALSGEGRWWPASVCVSRPTSSSVATIALASAVLRGMPRPSDSEIDQLRSVFEALSLSTAASAATPRGEEEKTDPLVRRADAVIAANAHEPDFSVESLAGMLSVSRRHLTRVLSRAGRAPADRIRDVRLGRVRTAWDAHGDELLRDDLLARWFGFRSARALRESLSRAGDLGV